MRVHVLGHVLAQHHRVTERAEIALQVLHRLAGLLILEMDRHVGFFAGDDLRRLDLQIHLHAVGGLHERRVRLQVGPRRGDVAVEAGGGERRRDHLRAAADRHEIAEQHVLTRRRQHVLDRERAVLLEHRVLVEELLHVARDDEEVEEAIVHFGELRDRLVGQRVADDDAELGLLSGLDGARLGGDRAARSRPSPSDHPARASCRRCCTCRASP